MIRLSCPDKTERQVPTLFAMDKITQTMRYRQTLICYAKKYGVTKAVVRYHTNRQYIYRWLKCYNGTLASLADRSHRPRSHPNQHTDEEIRLILNMRRGNPISGIVVFWVKASPGVICALFPACIASFVNKMPNPKKHTPKPYEQMQYH